MRTQKQKIHNWKFVNLCKRLDEFYVLESQQYENETYSVVGEEVSMEIKTILRQGKLNGVLL